MKTLEFIELNYIITLIKIYLKVLNKETLKTTG